MDKSERLVWLNGEIVKVSDAKINIWVGQIQGKTVIDVPNGLRFRIQAIGRVPYGCRTKDRFRRIPAMWR